MKSHHNLQYLRIHVDGGQDLTWDSWLTPMEKDGLQYRREMISDLLGRLRRIQMAEITSRQFSSNEKDRLFPPDAATEENRPCLNRKSSEREGEERK
jgi:hypothetical protein